MTAHGYHYCFDTQLGDMNRICLQKTCSNYIQVFSLGGTLIQSAAIQKKA